MSETPETDACWSSLNDFSDVELRIMTEHARKIERERDKARRELQLLLESTKVETCEPLPERDGEPADFSGAIRRMRLAEEERDQWRACARGLAAAASDMQSGWFYIQEVYGRLSGVGWDRTAQGVEAALAEFERLKGKTK
jgi:hypothetical protein